MDRSSHSNNSSSTASTASTSGTRSVRAKQTLLDDWFGNSWKQTGSDFEVTGLNLTLHEDSDNDPESAEAVVLETAPLAKKSRVSTLNIVHDTIEIGDSSVDSDCHSDSDIGEDEPVEILHSVSASCNSDSDSPVPSNDTSTVLTSSTNSSSIIVSGVKVSAQQTQMRNPPEHNIAVVATSPCSTK